MPYPLVFRIYGDIKGMGFRDYAIAAKEISLFIKGKVIDNIAGPAEINRQVDIGGIDRLSLVIGIDAKFRRHTGLEDGDFNGKVTFCQQASVMETTGIVRLLPDGFRHFSRRDLLIQKPPGGQQSNNDNHKGY
jgi:hypothetical protein